MWVTEISDITPLDVSMEDGLRWATAFHEYLMEAQVSAIIWWLGAQPTKTNESLIVLNQQEGSFIQKPNDTTRLGTIRVTFHVEAEVWATSRTDFLKK